MKKPKTANSMTFEGIANFKYEDGSKAMIAEIDGPNPRAENGPFVRLQSWDKSMRHPWFKSMDGAKVKVTVTW